MAKMEKVLAKIEKNVSELWSHKFEPPWLREAKSRHALNEMIKEWKKEGFDINEEIAKARQEMLLETDS